MHGLLPLQPLPVSRLWPRRWHEPSPDGGGTLRGDVLRAATTSAPHPAAAPNVGRRPNLRMRTRPSSACLRSCQYGPFQAAGGHDEPPAGDRGDRRADRLTVTRRRTAWYHLL